MSRPSTPLRTRAIPSSLGSSTGSGSNPPPPSSHLYEPLVKNVLRQRVAGVPKWGNGNSVFMLMSFWCWGSTGAWAVWFSGSKSSEAALKSIFAPATFGVTIMTWLFVVVPVVVLRKVNLTPVRTPASSPSKLWNSAMARAGTRRAWMVYSISAVGLLVLHVSMVYANLWRDGGRDPAIWLFVKSKKYPYYLNARLLFLLLSQLTLAFGSLVRNIMLDRFVFRWSVSSSPYRLNIFELVRIIILVSIFTTVSLVFTSFGFIVIRLGLLPLINRLPILPSVLRPFIGHFLSGKSTRVVGGIVKLPFENFGLVVRAWWLGFTTLFLWEVAEVLFDALIPKPVFVHNLVPPSETTATAISGLSSKDKIMQYFALLELKTLLSSPLGSDPNYGDEKRLSESSTRRSDLFTDTKYSPSQWSQLCRECLILLGEDYQVLLRRGAPALPPIPTPTPAVEPMPATPLSSRPNSGTVIQTPLLRKDIFRKEARASSSPIQTVMESFASDGSFVRALDEGAEIMNDLTTRGSEGMPTSAVAKFSRVDSFPKLPAILDGKCINTFLQERVEQYTPSFLLQTWKQWKTWWNTERPSRTVETCLMPFAEMDVVVVEVLSSLICASLTEDRYGVVQRDIPKVLEALTSFLDEVEVTRREINGVTHESAGATIDGEKDDGLSEKTLQQQLEVEKANEVLGVVGNALKQSISQITLTFGDKLSAFKFPPRVASRLQGFVEYV